MSRRTLYGTVIVTYRCNARCNMCDCFRDPTRPDEEITLADIKKLPEMAFTNITGGEPFIRQDIPDIVRELYKKSYQRTVILRSALLLFAGSSRRWASASALKDCRRQTIKYAGFPTVLTGAIRRLKRWWRWGILTWALV